MHKDEYFKTLKRICGLAAQIGLDHFMGSETSKEETAYKYALTKILDDYADLNIEIYRLKKEIASAPVHIAAKYLAENKCLRESAQKLDAISGLVSFQHGDDDRYDAPEDEMNDTQEMITIKRIFKILDGEVGNE